MTITRGEIRGDPVGVGPKPSFRRDIQGLRAIAVLLVILGHANVTAIAGGFVGVDIFFVISGFLITGLLLNDVASGAVRFAHFYARRAVRILPAATVVILATGIASMFVLNTVRFKQELTDSVWASLFAANVKFSRDGTDYFSQVSVSPLQHYWSLAVEEQFYLAWPTLIAVSAFALPLVWSRRAGRELRRKEHPIPRRRIAAVLVLAGLASFGYSLRIGSLSPTAAYFSTIGRGWELIAGALLAVAGPHLMKVPGFARATMTWVGVTGIVVAAVTFDAHTSFPGRAALLPVLAACAVLAGGVGEPRLGANRVLAGQPLRFVGDMSYSLYLWHWPLLTLGVAYAGHPLTGAQNVLAVGATVWLSIASYLWVETPLRRPGRLFRATPALALLIWPVAVGSVLLLVHFGQRVDAPTRAPATPAVASTSRPGVAEVKAAVVAALRGAKVPADLDPSFGNILADVTTIGDCSGYGRTQNKICQYGDAHGTKKVVLFGNSHAVAWLPAIGPIAKAGNRQLFPMVKESCDYGEFVGDGRNSQCATWYAWAKQEIRDMHPDLIVMTAYSGGDDWEVSLARVVTDLKPLAAGVQLMSDPPGVAVAPVDCLQRRQATLQSCLFPLTSDAARADRAQSALAAGSRIGFIDVHPWFCYESRCPSVISGLVVYTDVDHLTETYAAHLTPVLKAKLNWH